MAIEAGIQIARIPYRGGWPAATAVASGEVDVSVVSYSSTKPFIDTGDVVVLSTASGQRIPPSPDTRTIEDAGVPNVDTSQWTGLVAPAGTPDDVLEKLNAAINEVLSDPAVIERLEGAGAAPYPPLRKEFSALLDRLRPLFASIIETAGIEPQ